jgi:hypothetical protein
MKHYLIYYKQGTGTFIVTEPRPWARENQHHFPGFNFINAQVGNHPTTGDVEDYLMANFGFIQNVNPAAGISLLYNFDPNVGI